MLNKYFYSLIATFLLLSGIDVLAQDSMSLSTLFTTAQERQIINANRHKKEIRSKPRIQPVNDNQPLQVRELIMEEVNVRYKISGISINADGTDIAWVNGQTFENGARMDDGSRLRINNAAIKSVSITTPDGKRHTGTSGETLEVSYMRVLEE